MSRRVEEALDRLEERVRRSERLKIANSIDRGIAEAGVVNEVSKALHAIAEALRS